MYRPKQLLMICFFLAFTPIAFAQNPNYNVGPVWRVIYVTIKPGQGDAFWNDVRTHLRPIWNDQKAQGLLLDYKLFTNPVANQPKDWNVAVAFQIANWAALDAFAAKGDTIATKHYGSREAMIEAGRKRSEMAEVISNNLVREVTLK
jgi:hypothetical protein